MSWWILAWILPGYFVQTTIHEGGHALLARIFGARITSFRVWPHKNAAGRFYFGRVTWVQPDPPIAGPRRAAISLAPYITASVEVPALLVVWFFTRWDPLLVLAASALVDLVRGLLQPILYQRGDVANAGKQVHR